MLLCNKPDRWVDRGTLICCNNPFNLSLACATIGFARKLICKPLTVTTNHPGAHVSEQLNSTSLTKV